MRIRKRESAGDGLGCAGKAVGMEDADTNRAPCKTEHAAAKTPSPTKPDKKRKKTEKKRKTAQLVVKLYFLLQAAQTSHMGRSLHTISPRGQKAP